MAIIIREDNGNSGLFQSGYGVPTHLSPKGTLFVEKNSANVYINKNNLAYWVELLDSTNANITGDYLPLSGGTVYGPTSFTNGLTANTISATSINKVNYIVFNTGTTSATTVPGTFYFDNTEKALSYNTSINQGVTVNMGQQSYLRVFNNSGTGILKGKVVEILSAYSGLPVVTLAVNRHSNDNDVVGVAAETIPNNSEGIVLTYGIISNITVTGGSIGSLVYASDTTPGEIKNATEFLAFPLTARTNAVGYVIQTGTTDGKIFVNPVNENNNLSLTNLQRNVLEGSVISTGVFAFSGITLASSTTFNVSPAEGWIVDNTTNPLVPDVFYIKYTGQTNIPSLYYSSATQTYLLLTSAGTLTQQVTFPTPRQRRQSVYLGKMGHGNRTSLINAFSEPDFEISPISQIRDMFTPIKLINENVYPSPNTGLTFNTSSGILWGLGIGFSTDLLNPSSITISGNSPTTFQYRTQTGGTASNRTTIIPGSYDLNGLITSIGPPAKQATNQRIYLLQNGQIRIQYGQTIYTDLTAAIAAVTTESFTTFSNFRDNALLIAILSVRSDASLLSDTSQAKITFASKFGESVGGTGGVSTTNLQQAYNNSTNPEIIINSTLGELTIQNGAGTADNITNLLEGKNAATSTTSFIRADGLISGNTLSTPSFTANTNGLTATTMSTNNLKVFNNVINSGATNNLTISVNTGGTVTYDAVGTNPFHYFADNVGIGTPTNAAYKLDVLGSSNYNGQAIFQGQSTDGGQLGNETLTTGSGTNWSGTSYTSGYTHTTGSTVALTSVVSVINGAYYQVIFTISNRTAGTVTVSLGGSLVVFGATVGSTYYINTISNAALILTPSTDFNGKVIASVKLVNNGTASIVFNNNSLVANVEMRNFVATNQFLGLNSGSKFLSGANNIGFGPNALANLIAGDTNVAIGSGALQGNYYSSANIAIGYNSQVSSLTGFNNISIGFNSLRLLTTGYQNTVVGYTALQNATAPTYNVAIGQDAGSLTGAFAAVTSISQSVFIGMSTKASTVASDTNTIVIGYGAIGLGLNSTVIGNSSTTGTTLYGNVTAIRGMYALSAYTGTFTNGIVSDYLANNGRISVGTGTTITFYNGGVAVNPLMTISTSGTVSANEFSAITLTSKGIYGTTLVNANNTNGMLAFSGSGTIGGTGYTDFIRVTNTAAGVTNPNKTFRLNNTGGIEIINSTYLTNIFTLTDAGVLSTPGGGTSDKRVKNNIEYLFNESSSKIKLLKPVKFEFNAYSGIKRHGFIAQDVLEIEPELVLGDGDQEDGTYGLDYDGILAFTVKSLQESIQRIEQLEKEIKELNGN
jgi:hypothetical protein